MIYVASSWKNQKQPEVIRYLREAGYECYDFKDSEGFHWSEVDLDVVNDKTYASRYLKALHHPRAIQGYNRDMEALQKSDTVILVLPCGRSAHLELGWAVGNNKRTAILLDVPLVMPELMYKMVNYLATNKYELIEWLKASG